MAQVDTEDTASLISSRRTAARQFASAARRNRLWRKTRTPCAWASRAPVTSSWTAPERSVCRSCASHEALSTCLRDNRIVANTSNWLGSTTRRRRASMARPTTTVAPIQITRMPHSRLSPPPPPSTGSRRFRRCREPLAHRADCPGRMPVASSGNSGPRPAEARPPRAPRPARRHT